MGSVGRGFYPDSTKEWMCQSFLEVRYYDHEKLIPALLGDYKNTLSFLFLSLPMEGHFLELIEKEVLSGRLLLTFEEYFCSLMIHPGSTDASQQEWGKLSPAQKQAHVNQFHEECIRTPKFQDIVQRINTRILKMRDIIHELSSDGVLEVRKVYLEVELQKCVDVLRGITKARIPEYRERVSTLTQSLLYAPSPAV